MSASEVPLLHVDDEPTALSASGEPAAVMGRYRLGKRLGCGAFGTVWSARDERLDRDVAVKLLPRERVIHARFEREARAAARLQHPAIVTLYEAAVDDEGAYLVSELVRGRTFGALLQQGRLSDRDIIEVGLALCGALGHAHSQGVIHRDVKPSNVLVPNRSAGGVESAKLTDFGVAQVLGADNLTQTGDVVGTLAYMAPEQADGREVGPEADLYSLALILYEALTGVNPQAGSRAAADGRRHGASFVPPLRRQRRDLNRRLAAGIDRALRSRAHDRGTLEDLRAALADSLDTAEETRGVVLAAGRAHDGDTWVRDEPGPAWQAPENSPIPRTVEPRTAARRIGRIESTGAAEAPLTWLPRAGNAAAAGIGSAWLLTHLYGHPPLPAAVVALGFAILSLLLPLVGSLATAVALGSVGLAGAYPGVVARLGSSWWRRALFAAVGFCLLIGVSKAAHQNLYWSPARFPPAHGRGLAAIAVWALAAAVQPLMRTRRFPLLEIALCALWSAAIVIALGSVGAAPLRGALAGALLGMLIVAWRPLLGLTEETRRLSGSDGDVA